MDFANASARRRRPLLRKSGSGCRDCRLRKCDEIEPVCSNCRRRYVNVERCDWSTRAPRGGVPSSKGSNINQLCDNNAVEKVPAGTTDASVTFLGVNPAFHPSTLTSTSRWRTLELRLMYHYTAVVHRTMPSCNHASAEAWQRTIPQLSFESELMLNPMLALSALHLHAHSQDDPDMAITLRRYLDRSLVSHRQALSRSTEESWEQLWLSAVILSHIYWLLAHQAQPNEAYELPIQAFMMLKGLSALYEQGSVSLGCHGYEWMDDNQLLPSITTKVKLSLAAQIQLQSIEDDVTNLLKGFDVSNMLENDKSIYMDAKDYVLNQYRVFFSGNDSKIFQRFISFIALKCQPRYRDKLRKYDPLAMALMSRMMISISGSGDAWWMKGKGNYEVMERDVRGIRELMPANFQWAMDWPCKVLDGEIVLKKY